MELEAVRRRVVPTTLARERTLPTPDALSDLFPEKALVRGRVLSCRGPASSSLALALVAPAMVQGSWAALIDVPTVGLDAATEHGVPLHRLVRVTSSDWPAAVAAAIDGFDLVVTAMPARSPLRRAAAGMLSSRLRQRGTVLVVIGPTGELPCDGRLTTAVPRWEGLGAGHGRLCRRRIEVEAAGRRLPPGPPTKVLLPATTGRVESIREEPPHEFHGVDEFHEATPSSGVGAMAGPVGMLAS